MPRRQSSSQGQIVLFPSEEHSSLQPSRGGKSRLHTPTQPPRDDHQASLKVVLSGTYRKDLQGLTKSFEELKDLGLLVLSPANVSAIKEEDGFVFMAGEENIAPHDIEDKHLRAIQHADFVWLHAPDGYVGISASLEVGFAKAAGKPVFSSSAPVDPVLAEFVEVVDSVAEAMARAFTPAEIPALPSLSSLQSYYRRVAIHRGYERESAQDCLLLMIEEVGELARALRKSLGLTRHGPPSETSEALELADVALYTVHMANILDIDLGEALQAKEAINSAKFKRSQRR